MYRVWTDLGQPFGYGPLPKKLDWKFDDLGIVVLDSKPEVLEYWEFNTISDANDWIDSFFNKRMLKNQWVPARGTFEVKEVTALEV